MQEEEEASPAVRRAEEGCALLERAAHYGLIINVDLQVRAGLAAAV